MMNIPAGEPSNEAETRRRQVGRRTEAEELRDRLEAKAKQTVDRMSEKLEDVTSQVKHKAREATGVVQEKLREVRREVRDAEQSPDFFWRMTQKSSFIWPAVLGFDLFVWGIIGTVCLFFPTFALWMQGVFARTFGWAGPSSTIASNTLLMYVQVFGTMSLAMLAPIVTAFINRKGRISTWYCLQKLIIAIGVAFTILSNIDKTTYRVLIPVAFYSFWQGVAASFVLLARYRHLVSDTSRSRHL